MKKRKTIKTPKQNNTYSKEIERKCYVTKGCIWIFIIIISLPQILSFFKLINVGKTYDVQLNGFEEPTEKPVLTFDNWWNGDFQVQETKYFEENMPLRGVMTKTYNTYKWDCFHLGNRIVGKDDFIFESSYIDLALALGNCDYSSEEKKAEMQQFVDELEKLNRRLKDIGKVLYVYIPPNKAECYPDNIPSYYLAEGIRNENAIDPIETFRIDMSNTEIPFLICRDMKASLQYPAFYSTGIHWSRTFEQTTSQRVISDINTITGKNYRNIQLTEVYYSYEPIWRETDVYNLLNVWPKYSGEFYVYGTTPNTSELGESLRILIYGDSFAEGLYTDVLTNLPEDRIHFVCRNDYMVDGDRQYISLNKDWNNMDFEKYLNDSDVVIVEMVEPEIVNYTFGFVESLNKYLEETI